MDTPQPAATPASSRSESTLPAANRPARFWLRRPAVWTGLAVAALLLLAYAWRHQSSATTYQTVAVSRGTVQQTITSSGTVNPVTTIQVGTYVSGVIQSITCDFNARVKAGQRCAKIDPRPYQTVVDQETAALGTSRAQLAKDQANLEYTRLEYQRAVKLLEQHMVAQDAVDTTLNTFKQAGAQVELDQATVAQHAAALNAARVNLDYTDIRSPVDGTVVSRNVTQGQTVAASFQTPTLFLIATDLTQMQVDTNVSESDIGRIKEGDRVLFTVEAYPDRTFAGGIVQKRQAPQSVQNVITYDAVVGIGNADLRLMPGMTAAVRIVTAERSGVLRVPNQALRYLPGGPGNIAQQTARSAATSASAARPAAQRRGTVWRLHDGRPVAVALELGLEDDAYTEVVGDVLREGEPVIVGESAAATGGGTPRMPRL